MYNPADAGEILREEYPKPLGLTVTSTAGALGVSRNSLSRGLNERARRTAADFEKNPGVSLDELIRGKGLGLRQPGSAPQ